MQLKPELKNVLESLGASDEDEQIMLDFFVNQLASAEGQVQGFINNIANLERQQADAQAQADSVSAMIAKFTVPDDQ